MMFGSRNITKRGTASTRLTRRGARVKPIGIKSICRPILLSQYKRKENTVIGFCIRYPYSSDRGEPTCVLVRRKRNAGRDNSAETMRNIRVSFFVINIHAKKIAVIIAAGKWTYKSILIISAMYMLLVFFVS